MAWPGVAGHGLVRRGAVGRGRAWRGEARQGLKMPKIEVSKIVLDESLFPRNGVSDFHVARLANAFKSGAKLPPVTLEARTNRLVDGWHRVEMFKREGVATTDYIAKTYKNEADLFADAVRLNIGHGAPLDLYSVRSAIIRLTTYGYTKQAIAECVRMPLEQIEKIERGFASDATTGAPVALKGGLSHLAGHTLDDHQREINRRYSGPKAIFFVRQIAGLLANGMHPDSKMFADEMDALCKLWSTVKAKGKGTAA
jgi:hypothetical protein